MKTIKLEKIAEIYSGLVLQRFGKSQRSKKTPHDQSTVSKKHDHLTLKSVTDNKIDINLLESVVVDRRINDKYLLKKGDIVMKLASPYSAAVINFECESLIAPANFAIIRTEDEFDPVYLSFVLNGEYVRRQLAKFVAGVTLPTIKIKDLKTIEIKIRPKTEQIKYGELFSLVFKRRELLYKRLELEKLIIDDILAEL
ncbi:MAG: hypothetical protein FGO69_09340 [Methanobacterium sp.]|nr:MAG: hypothetical protein FGO69_09340 [Methanobacterium sp.]